MYERQGGKAAAPELSLIPFAECIRRKKAFWQRRGGTSAVRRVHFRWARAGKVDPRAYRCILTRVLKVPGGTKRNKLSV